ncbi:WhiB family transcriptional regulator [Streptomyces sp. NBC_00568]|uniref:WhiB family transcriptional regulator n=1 Tax=Streptomyces sp. NBC_00568 TaxID=2975779 RepID=UPI0022537902|nr:WhiB family transcriptional regulator [Streptomyces sp. NBC_00568]MCX4993515.1 WhiB family transcriptional regulator [Streptomyces sp. NBC_00568]
MEPLPPTTGAEPCAGSRGFFLDSYAPQTREVLAAGALCRRCPVAKSCLIWALANPTLAYDGIWAATTPSQRRTLRKRLLHRLGPDRLSQTLRTEYARARADLVKTG